MTLFHRNVAIILHEMEDYLTTLRQHPAGVSGVASIRGQQTGSDAEAILNKIEAFKKNNPQIENLIKMQKESGSGDYSGGSSSGGSGGGKKLWLVYLLLIVFLLFAIFCSADWLFCWFGLV